VVVVRKILKIVLRRNYKGKIENRKRLEWGFKKRLSNLIFWMLGGRYFKEIYLYLRVK